MTAPVKLSYAQPYSDGSGFMWEVAYTFDPKGGGGRVEIIAGAERVDLDPTNADLGQIIDALAAIKAQVGL